MAQLLIRQLWEWRSYVIASVAPLILSLLFIYDGTEYQKPARCTFVILLLVIYWTTECIPIAVTALLPMFMFPLLKISTAKELAPKYMSEINMAFIGSYTMVLAFEHANLHKRFALRILMTVGPQPRWLLFGTMMSACFLSMFTNNAMSCALHLPIVKGIIDELREAAQKQADKKAASGVLPHIAEHEDEEEETEFHAGHAVDTEIGVPSPGDLNLNDKDDERSVAESIELRHLEQNHLGVLEIKAIHELPVDVPTDFQTTVEPVETTRNRATDESVLTSATTAATIPTTLPSATSLPAGENDEVLSTKTIDGLEKMLLIAAAYSASIGGMCTLIGTPTNLIMKDRADHVYEAYNCTQPVTFTSWLVFGVPVGYLFLFVAWFWLQIFFLSPKYVYRMWVVEPVQRLFNVKSGGVSEAQARQDRQNARVTAVIQQLYAHLEPMGFHQYAVLINCILLVVILITRQMSTGDSDSFIGWGVVAPQHVRESTATILVAASMFFLPSQLPSFRSGIVTKAPPPLLTWRQVEEGFPFGVILLLGGGMAAATGAQVSGIPGLIAPIFQIIMSRISLQAAVLLTSILVACMTEVMSNIACVTLIAPILEKVAKELNVSPLLFLFPTTLSASFAFMLPVATPSNAIVFSTNRLRIIDMVLCGIGMNIIGVFVVFLAVNTWGNAYFNLYSPPCS